MKFDHVFIIGCGGTGSHLIEPLVRALHYHENGTQDITVVDGDIFEESNETRQLFPRKFLGENKAKVMADELAHFGVKAVMEYIDEAKWRSLLEQTIDDDFRRNLLIITAVDNHATRKAVLEELTLGDYENFVWLSPGNGFDSGQVVAHVVVNGEEGTLHPFKKYPDLAEPEDHIPGTGCQEEAVSEPQLVTANQGAAFVTMLMVMALLNNKPWYDEVHFNSITMKVEGTGDPIQIGGGELETDEQIEAEAETMLEEVDPAQAELEEADAPAVA